MSQESICGVCHQPFPTEHQTVCLIGTVLCPPCEVKQQRFPSYALMDDADLNWSLDRIVDNGELCEQHGECPCNDHRAERIVTAHNKAMAEKEAARMQQVIAWASLPFYKRRVEATV